MLGNVVIILRRTGCLAGTHNSLSQRGQVDMLGSGVFTLGRDVWFAGVCSFFHWKAV